MGAAARQPRRDDVLIANLRLTDGDKDHEADLVVLMPDIGVVVLEVKGGSVCVEPDEAEGHVWWTQSSGTRRQIHPVDQARGQSTRSAATSSSTPRVGRRAASRGRTESSRPTRPSAKTSRARAATVVAARQGRHGGARRRVRDATWWMQHGGRPPSYDDVEVLAEILAGRFATPYDINAESDDRAAECRPAHPGAGHDPAR